MRVLIPFLVVAIVLAVDGKLLTGLAEENCLKEIGLTKDEFDNGCKKDWKDVDTKIKCMGKCLLKEHKIMKDDGTLDSLKGAELLLDEKDGSNIGKLLIEHCTKKLDDECETAFLLVKCLHDKIDELDKALKLLLK